MTHLFPAAADMRPMFTLDLHASLVGPLVAISPRLDPDELEAWADTCDNPVGQRAALARAVAHLGRVSPLKIAAGTGGGTFWDAVGAP